MAPIHVLQAVPAMDVGGLETFVMNVYRQIDRDKVQFDFLYHYTRPCAYDDEILALGGRIFRCSVREDNHFPRYLHQLNRLFALHPEIEILHGHYTGFAVFYNRCARKHGVATRIVHSHNTHTEKSLTGLFDAALSRFAARGATHRFSCGAEAGRALYGRRDFAVYPNGIETARFAHNAARRRAARARWGLDGAAVYGHIGRFTQQKNHAFLLDVFAETARRQPQARLLLAGDGPLRPQAERKAAALHLTDKVVFAGLQKDTPALYDAMDCFLLPSLFEGLPVVLVEAQAAGLPCFVSDAVSAEARLTPCVRFLPLGLGPAGWAAALGDAPPPREDALPALKEAGYDIADTARRLSQFYLQRARHKEGEER